MSANDSGQTFVLTGGSGGQLNIYTKNGGSGNNINFVATQNNSDIMFNDNHLYITKSSGNVGIGLTDPDAKLEILSTSSQQKWSYDGSNNATMTVASDGSSTLANSGGNFTIDSPGDIVLDAAGSDVIFKKSGTNYIKVSDVGSTNVQLYATAQLQMSANDSGQTFVLTGGQSGGQLNIYTRNGGSGNNINFVATQADSDIMFNSNHLYIKKSSGNVGIGTSGPDRKLDILDASNHN